MADKCDPCPYEHDRDSLKAGINQLTKQVSTFGESLRNVERKVFNGFGQRIDSVAASVAREATENATHREAMQRQMESLWKFIVGALLSILLSIVGIMGIMWNYSAGLDDRVQSIETAVQESRNEIFRQDFNPTEGGQEGNSGPGPEGSDQ